MLKRLLAILLWLTPIPALAQTFPFPAAAAQDERVLTQALPDLARRALAVYSDADRDRYLSTRSGLLMTAGEHRRALDDLQALGELRRAANPAQDDPAPMVSAATVVPYRIIAEARLRQAASGATFDEAFGAAFREVYGGLDDKSAWRAAYWLWTRLPARRSEMRAIMDRLSGKAEISLADALDLIRAWQVLDTYQALMPLADPLIAEDQARRYVVEDKALIRTPDGASLQAIVVRPRAGPALPTLLHFTIYADDAVASRRAMQTAAYGYVGVVAYSRGKGISPDAIVPYEHDGDDARAVIDWIARQPWSDGRVGMYGGSYTGFTQWAAAKRLPTALKAIMPQATAAPGIDVPMQGNVFKNFMYRWGPHATNNRFMDNSVYDNPAPWDRLNRDWYASGRPYRDMEAIKGEPNPLFRLWIEHPDYDAYWRALIPYGREFAGIDIPVLQTTGYFDGGQIGVLYYWDQHHRFNRRADHTLLVGPYGHMGAQHQSDDVIDGYAIDPAARIDMHELRYQWFDHVLKGGPRPRLLKDRVNYEVMGANAWRHVPSLEAMGTPRRFYLDGGRLNPDRPANPGVVTHRVDLADRSDADLSLSTPALTDKPDLRNAVVFTSDPVTEPVEIAGLFAARLDFTINKRDADVRLQLYELMPDGRYLELSHTTQRLSYAQDRARRRLLRPGRRERLTIAGEGITARRMAVGSRLVLAVAVMRQPDTEINYGTGAAVSRESIADAGEPLEIRWRGGSFIEVRM